MTITAIYHGTDSYIAIKKNEDGTFDGALTIKDRLYEFEKAEMLHIAASVGVSLDLVLEPMSEQLKNTDLTKLGQSIDLLVQSQIIKKSKEIKIEKSEEKIMQPVIQYPVSKKQVIKPAKIQKSIKLTKSEASKICLECGNPYFNDDKFTGCFCLTELSKNINTEKNEYGYILKFNLDDIGEDEQDALISVFKDA